MIIYSIIIDLNNRFLFLSDRRIKIGSDVPLPVILSVDAIGENASFTIIDKDLDYCGFFINRKVCIYELDENSQSINDGVKLFDGIISSEPSLTNDIFSFTCSQPQVKNVFLPGNGWINDKLIPDIYGTVQDVELIPDNTPYVTELAIDADANDLSLRVRDATGLTDVGTVVIDGKEYDYTSKTDNLLFIGIDVNDFIREGTAVAQKGEAVYIAAGHELSAMDNIKLNDTISLAGRKDLVNASVTFDTVPTVAKAKGIENILAEFDEVDTLDNATDSINAIRAVTAQYNQNGTTVSFSTGAVELSRSENIDFPAPPTDKIIQGAYGFNVSVNHNGNTGDAEVTIASQIVWVLRSGVVVYNPGVISFFNNESTNQLSVNINRNSVSGSIDVDVTASVRVIFVGNLDSSFYALLANGKNFVVNQTTDMPIRGKITRARVAVEWFSTDEFQGIANVIFDGATLGQLNLDNVDGGSDTLTISADTVSSGTATLDSNIVSGISSQPATQDNRTEAVEATMILSYATMAVNTTNGFITSAPIVTKLELQQGVVAGNYTIYVKFRPKSGITSQNTDFIVGGLRKSIPSTQSSEVSFTVSLTTGQTSIDLFHGASGAPNGAEFPFTSIFPSQNATAASVRVSLIIKPTLSTLTVGGGGYSGTPALATTNAPNAGVVVSPKINGSSSVQVTIPAPPRTVINYFDLTFREWFDFTNKQLKISYSTSGGEKIALVRALIAIDYDVNVNTPVSKVSATLTGYSGNPADVIKRLTDLSGQVIDMADYQDLRELSETNNYKLARVINDKTDVLELLAYTVNQSSVYYHNGNFKHWFQNDCNITELTENDCLSPIGYTWSEDVYTVVNLKYKLISGNLQNTITANTLNNSTCKLTEQAILEVREIDLECKWIQDDDTAVQYLTDFVRRFCQMRRVISLSLPDTFDFLNVNNGISLNTCNFKIINKSKNDVSISLIAEEIKQ